MTDPILLRKLWCHVLFHDDWRCLSMSCLETVLSHDVMPWDILSHDIIYTVIHDPSWPHLSHDIIGCFSLLKLYFNCNFFLLSPFFYIQLPFISSFLVYSTSSFDYLSHFVSKTFDYDVFLVDCNPRLYDCSSFNIID